MIDAGKTNRLHRESVAVHATTAGIEIGPGGSDHGRAGEEGSGVGNGVGDGRGNGEIAIRIQVEGIERRRAIGTVAGADKLESAVKLA